LENLRTLRFGCNWIKVTVFFSDFLLQLPQATKSILLQTIGQDNKIQNPIKIPTTVSKAAEQLWEWQRAVVGGAHSYWGKCK